MSASRDMENQLKLDKMRDVMRSYGLDAFLVFSADAHMSEYVADHDKRRAFLSGFNGSAGTAVVTQTEAALWTDGRYFNQATLELTKQWTLMKCGLPGVPEIGPWLSSALSADQVVGVDPSLITAKEARALMSHLSSKGIKLSPLKPQQTNPVDIVWDELQDVRPPPPSGPIKVHPIKYSGMHHMQKLRNIQVSITQNGADFGIFSSLDEIAWLFNIRGSDVAFNPVVKSYSIVFSKCIHECSRDDIAEQASKKAKVENKSLLQHKAYLFIEENKLSTEVQDHLFSSDISGESVEIIIRPYHSVTAFVRELAHDFGKAKVLLDSNSLNWEIYGILKEGTGIEIIDMPSVVAAIKTIKNPVELQGFRDSHIRDGAALTAFLSWLDNYMKTKAKTCPISEKDAAVKLESFRSAMPLYISPSFETISSYGSNGAIIHYHPPYEGSALIGYSSLYLLDSGGQYADGTTDVTRTLYFGQCEFDERTGDADKYREMKEAYTYVLKSHISLATARFPEGTFGYRLDAITRAPMWAAGLDYAHGTGHGVGSYLNVHEGPQGIGVRPRQGDMGFKSGMMTSNEPGYYKDGEYGIRIENICVTTETDGSCFPIPTSKKFLGFETLTMCPLERRLINVDMLTEGEQEWVNSYHTTVRTLLRNLISEHFPQALPFLLQATEPL